MPTKTWIQNCLHLYGAEGRQRGRQGDRGGKEEAMQLPRRGQTESEAERRFDQQRVDFPLWISDLKIP